MLLAPRYLPRLAALVGLFTRYGLADFARVQGLKGIAPDLDDVDSQEAAKGHEQAVAFRRRLVELGPAYVKLGQVLSTRPDLLPETYIRELEKLQDDVDPIMFDQVADVLEGELGARINKLFVEFDEAPLGTASLGQVHAAVLRGGRHVVVKVQRPGIRAQLADDIEFFREVAGFLTAHTSAGQRIDMVGVIQQLERALADELDYRVEARNAASFRRALAGFPRLLIPKVIEAYTTEKVLTTERVRGAKIDEVSPLTRLEHDFRPVAEELTRAYLKMITLDGHFHADPHPGNVFVVLPGRTNPRTPSEIVAGERRGEDRGAATALAQVEKEAQEQASPAVPTDEVKLALIDFGMTARLAEQARDNIVRLLLDLSENRGESAAETMIEMGSPTDHFDRATYTREIAALIAQNANLSIADIHAGTLLYEMISLSFRHGLRMPAELTLLAKALFNLDAVSRALDPHFSPIDAIRDFTTQLANERAKRDLSPRRMFQVAMETSDFISSLPRRLDLFTQRLASNEFAVKMDIPQVPMLLKGMQKIANRIFTGLVLAGLLVASGMLLPYWRTLG
ncbi:MAG: AarF/UbiB family protein, partial [Gemmatimonadota bacterium]|nr:AarF/UbiB family protein [Gemmatimonadota bacterium]